MIAISTAIPILSALLAAVASILARVLLKDIPAKKILATNFLIMAATLLAISPFFYKFIFSWKSIALVGLIALIDSVANYFYFKTFEKTEASVAVPILSLAPMATLGFAAIVLGEYPSMQSTLTAIVIIASMIAISIDWKNLEQFKSATLYPAVISAVLFGASAIPSKYLLSGMEATNAPTLYMLRAALIGLFAACFFKNSPKELDTKTYRFIFLRGLFVIAQWILLYYALTLGSTGVAITLGNITPIFVLLISAIVLKERVNSKKILAALAILILSLTIV
jgi:transporter family protein